ncbi:MAG: hypothetical protein ABF811_08060 [Pseudoclavibacter sp.]
MPTDGTATGAAQDATTPAPAATGGNPTTPPAAAEWDTPYRHQELAHDLDSRYDGWAIVCAADTVTIPLDAVPRARLAVWVRPNAMPGGSRIINTWEGVVYHTPRLARAGVTVRDALVAPVRKQGFLGSKPAEWTRWGLALLGATGNDEVIDAFPGSGAIAMAAEGLLRTDLTGTMPV